MKFKPRKTKKKIFDNEYIFTPVSTQEKDNIEREYQTQSMTNELSELEEKLKEKSNIPEDVLKTMSVRKKEIVSKLQKVNPVVNDLVIMIVIKNTPNCPTIKELKTDSTLYGILGTEVGLFVIGTEYYKNTTLNVIKDKLIKMGDKTIKASDVYNQILEIEDDVASGEYKKKD